MNTERIIKILLIVMGLTCVIALIPTIMPLKWISETHKWLGLGQFPEQPIAEYLARGMSLMCAFYGGIVLMLSKNVVRYLPLIRFQAVFICCAAIGGMAMASKMGMPAKYSALHALGALPIMLAMVVFSFRFKPEGE